MVASINMSWQKNVDCCLSYLKEKENENWNLVDIPEFKLLIGSFDSSEIKFYELIESLGPQLTNTEVTERLSGTYLLADVIQTLPSNYLKSDEVKYLVTFFCDRLKDQTQLIPHVIRSLFLLTSFPTLPNDCAQLLVRTVFREVETQRQTQTTRQRIYILLANLLREKLSELQEIGADFIMGYIQAIDGEKDPRNLLIVFNTVPFIVRNFEIGHLAEELFEVVSCYFPIDFTPPPNNPHGVTKQDLILGLRQTLAATPLFAPFCIPLVIEKVDSAVQSSKIDALLTLVECSQTYGATKLRVFLRSLWNSIRREILMGNSEEVEAAALAAVEALVKTASDCVQKGGDKSILEELLQDIISDCRKYLCEPELKLMHPSARILQAAATASDASCEKILLLTIPLLMQQFDVHVQVNKRKTILDILNSFITICKQRNVIQTNEGSNHFDSIVTLYLSLLSDESEVLCQSALMGFNVMLSVSNLLNDSSSDTLAKHLLHITLKHHNENIRKVNVITFGTFAQVYPKKVEEQILPKLLEVIEKGIGSSLIENIGNDYHNAMDALAATCNSESVLKVLVPKLINHINNLSETVHPNVNDKASRCISCLQQIIANVQLQNNDFVYQHVIFPLLKIELQLVITNTSSCLNESNVLKHLADLLRESTRILNESQTQKLFEDLFPLLMSGESSRFQITNTNNHGFNIQLETEHLHIVALLAAVFCSLPGKVLAHHNINELVSRMEDMVKHAATDAVILPCVQMLASIVNKLPEGSELENVIQSLIVLSENLMDNVEETQNVKGLTQFLWLTKALVLRGHQRVELVVNRLIDLLSNDEFGKEAANGFDIILNELENPLSETFNGNVRMMYRQRFYQTTISRLIDGFNKVDSDEKRSHHLIAILHQLRHLPQQVLVGELQLLIPLLVRGLFLAEDHHLLSATLNTFTLLICDFPQSLTNHVTSLIPYFLQIARNNASMKIRMAALDCLNVISKQPTHVILPMKMEVVRNLAFCIDDKKRLVRQKAVVTRSNWYLVGAPGGTKVEEL